MSFNSLLISVNDFGLSPPLILADVETIGCPNELIIFLQNSSFGNLIAALPSLAIACLEIFFTLSKIIVVGFWNEYVRMHLGKFDQ